MIEIFGSQAQKVLTGGKVSATRRLRPRNRERSVVQHGRSGLMIAIPVAEFYRYFRGLVEAYTLDMEQGLRPPRAALDASPPRRVGIPLTARLRFDGNGILSGTIFLHSRCYLSGDKPDTFIDVTAGRADLPDAGRTNVLEVHRAADTSRCRRPNARVTGARDHRRRSAARRALRGESQAGGWTQRRRSRAAELAAAARRARGEMMVIVSADGQAAAHQRWSMSGRGARAGLPRR